MDLKKRAMDFIGLKYATIFIDATTW